MKRIPTLIALALGLALLAAAGPARAEDRLAAAHAAEEEFLRTHNYTFQRGLVVVPGVYELLGLLDHAPVRPVHRRVLEGSFGLNMHQGKPVGLFSVQEKDFKVGAFGCVACHSSKAAGRFYIGLGNKAIDISSIGQTIMKFDRPYRWTRPLRGAEHEEIVQRAFAFARKLVHPRITNATRGVVSMNHVNLWFFEMAGQDIPATMPRAGTKIPPLWGIAAKATQEGLFYDGLGRKGSIAWLALPELTAGQTAQNIRRDFVRIERLWDTITKFMPPAYPFTIDRQKAARGQVLYAQSCERCHGTYERDLQGLPVFKPPLFNTAEEIGTDTDRLDASSPLLRGLIERSPLKDLVQAESRPRGWFATRLDATWAAFPYLHNGSVPTLRDLLEKPSRRPHFWSLDRPGDRDRFDEIRNGLTVPAPGSFDARKLETFGRRGSREVYNVEREGHSNSGHDFGTDLNDADKNAVVEYLKTL